MAEEFKITNKTVAIAGRKLTVWKATFEAQLRRFTLAEEAEKRLNGNGAIQDGEGLEALIRRGFALRTYPALAASTTGKVFSEADCYRIENDDLDLWISTARELNPSWFPSQEPEDTSEVLEDKKKSG